MPCGGWLPPTRRIPALLASYADFLLDQGESRRALALLAPYPRQDTLLLRPALAQRAIGLAGDPPATAAADEHARRLALRFQEMRQRGDRSHLREQALFELGMRGDPVDGIGAHRAELGLAARARRCPPLPAGRARGRTTRGRSSGARMAAASGLKDARLEPDLAAVRRQAPTR